MRFAIRKKECFERQQIYSYLLIC